MKNFAKKLFTWANFWTVLSLTLGLVAYKVNQSWVGDASFATGALAFLVGLA